MNEQTATDAKIEARKQAAAQEAKELLVKLGGAQGEYLTTWRMKVSADSVDSLVEAHPKAVEFTKTICPDLKYAELVNAGDGDWLHVIRWATPVAYPNLVLRLLSNDEEAAQASTLDAFIDEDEFIAHGEVVNHV